MCYTVPIAGRGWQSRSLSDSQCSYNSDIIYVREQVCSSEEGHCGSARGTAVDGGINDTRSIQVVSFHLRVTYRLTLAHCVG